MAKTVTIITNINKNYYSSIFSGHLPRNNINLFRLLGCLIKVAVMSWILYWLIFFFFFFPFEVSFLRMGLVVGRICTGLPRTFPVSVLKVWYQSTHQFEANKNSWHPRASEIWPLSLSPKKFSVVSYMWTVFD